MATKKSIPASDPRYKKMTPAQRNANTALRLKESVGNSFNYKAPVKKKTPPPATKSKLKTIDGNSKVVVGGKNNIKLAPKSNKPTVVKGVIDSANRATPPIKSNKPPVKKDTPLGTVAKDLIKKTNAQDAARLAKEKADKAVKQVKETSMQKALLDRTTAGNIKTRDINPPKTAPNTTTKTTSTTSAGKTVSQLWVEKTGMPWSEAKKQGYSDGSAKSNMAIMAKLKAGETFKKTATKVADEAPITLATKKAEAVTTSSPNKDIIPLKKREEFRKGGTMKSRKTSKAKNKKIK